MNIISIGEYSLVKVSEKENPKVKWTINKLDEVLKIYPDAKISSNIIITKGTLRNMEIIDVFSDELIFINSRSFTKYMKINYEISAEELRSLLEFGDRNLRPIDKFTEEFTKFASFINGYRRFSNRSSQNRDRLLKLWKDPEYKEYMSGISIKTANEQWSNPDSNLRKKMESDEYKARLSIVSSKNRLSPIINKYKEAYLYLAEIEDSLDELKFGFTHFSDVSNRRDDWKGRDNFRTYKYSKIIKLVSGPSSEIADLEMNLKLELNSVNERINKSELNKFYDLLRKFLDNYPEINLEINLEFNLN